MKKLMFLVLTIFPIIGFSQSKPNDIIGVWLTQIKDSKIEVYKKDNYYYGKVIWIAEPNDEDGNPITDIKNPNANLKNRPILGMDILIKMAYDDGEYTDGYLYDPKDGEIYECKVWVEGKTLKVRGYLGWLFDTKTWTRVK